MCAAAAHSNVMYAGFKGMLFALQRLGMLMQQKK